MSLDSEPMSSPFAPLSGLAVELRLERTGWYATAKMDDGYELVGHGYVLAAALWELTRRVAYANPPYPGAAPQP